MVKSGGTIEAIACPHWAEACHTSAIPRQSGPLARAGACELCTDMFAAGEYYDRVHQVCKEGVAIYEQNARNGVFSDVKMLLSNGHCFQRQCVRVWPCTPASISSRAQPCCSVQCMSSPPVCPSHDQSDDDPWTPA
jgi:hypothetical protein